MFSNLCAFCEKNSHMTVKWGIAESKTLAVRFAATCDNCQNVSVGRGLASESFYPHNTTELSVVNSAVSSAAASGDIEWWPKIGETPEVIDVPEAISRAAREAYSSASVGNHMAAILMARTVVEATARNKGIRKGNLAGKIDELATQSFIRPAISEQAHEVRFAGNDMAHGDIDVEPGPTDSEEILALMAEVLAEVFQGPARLERIRNKRKAQTTQAETN